MHHLLLQHDSLGLPESLNILFGEQQHSRAVRLLRPNSVIVPALQQDLSPEYEPVYEIMMIQLTLHTYSRENESSISWDRFLAGYSSAKITDGEHRWTTDNPTIILRGWKLMCYRGYTR